MNIQRVKQGANITYFNGIYMIFLGIYLISFIDFNMKNSFNSIEQLWGFFTRYNSDIANIFYLFNILLGIILISLGILIIYLSDFIFKRKDKMAWVVLFVTGLASWVALLAITILMQNLILTIVTTIGWLMFALGMLLPIKYYLEKNYREY